MSPKCRGINGVPYLCLPDYRSPFRARTTNAPATERIIYPAGPRADGQADSRAPGARAAAARLAGAPRGRPACRDDARGASGRALDTGCWCARGCVKEVSSRRASPCSGRGGRVCGRTEEGVLHGGRRRRVRSGRVTLACERVRVQIRGCGRAERAYRAPRRVCRRGGCSGVHTGGAPCAPRARARACHPECCVPAAVPPAQCSGFIRAWKRVTVRGAAARSPQCASSGCWGLCEGGCVAARPHAGVRPGCARWAAQAQDARAGTPLRPEGRVRQSPGARACSGERSSEELGDPPGPRCGPRESGPRAPPPEVPAPRATRAADKGCIFPGSRPARARWSPWRRR